MYPKDHRINRENLNAIGGYVNTTNVLDILDMNTYHNFTFSSFIMASEKHN